MKKILYFIIFLFISGILLYTLVNWAPASDSKIVGSNVIINNKPIKVLIADELTEHIQGLSEREALCQDCGMLFIFPRKQIRSFWMKNMLFPIDIIWVADDIIVKIDKNLPPEGETPVKRYNSNEPVNYVLEVNSGFAEANNFKAGDKVYINTGSKSNDK